MSDDSAFFEELQMDFLNESSFLLEQYEEYMMSLENSTNPVKDLTDIFRVAHSVKGGAAAVGLTELSKFAHVMEDLLDLLRSKPEVVNSEIISLLLKSGDELRNRVSALQAGEDQAWNPEQLKIELIKMTESLTGKASKHSQSSSSDSVPASEAAESEIKMEAPADFFSEVANSTNSDGITSSVETGTADEDVVNHELLAELLSQLSPEDRAEYLEKEAAENNAAAIPTAIPVEPPTASSPKIALVNSSTNDTQTEATKTEATKTNSKAPAKNLNTTIKVDTGRVDSVLDAVGELVVLKNQLVHDETVQNSGNIRLEAIVDQLDKAVRELYEKTLSIRMTPLKSMFIKIQRIVRDVSLSLNKPVELNLVGEETEVERTVFDILGDPLVHLVRNSMDHGVEPKEVRLQKGKPEVAKVTVSAKQSGGSVIIEISDDGGGIDRDRVLGKAIEKGLIPEGVDPQSIPDEQVFLLIFNPGFSTADKISDLSGRGVGLDVVKSNLEKINGKINIFSKAGQGSTFRLTIPLSTAITDGIIVSIGDARYILPIHSIREIVRVLPSECTEISGAGKVVKIRENLLPILEVEHILGEISDKIAPPTTTATFEVGSMRSRNDELMLVVIETLNGQLAFPVDNVLGQAQVVVKPISTGLQIPEVAGAAILGDGQTVLILEPSAFDQGQIAQMTQSTSSKTREVAA